MVQTILNAFYSTVSNIVTWLFSVYITTGVTVGGVIVTCVLFTIVINGFLSVADSN